MPYHSTSSAFSARLICLFIVQSINIKEEAIELAGSNDTDADGLASAISNTEPRYSVFRYSHHQLEAGSEQAPIVFIYTCPSGSKIKERMVYASTKQSLLAAIGSEIGIQIAKKVSKHTPPTHTP